jgi:hypothetical protein
MPFTGRQKTALALVPLGVLLAACGSDNRGPPQFAELVPVEMMQAALPPQPAPPPPPVDTKPASPPPAAGPVYGGHLASYFRAEDARRGWNVIVRQQSSIGSLKPHIVPIKTPKGPMVRLIAGDFPSREEAERFCTWAHQQHLYCAVMVFGPNDQTASFVTGVKPRAGRAAARRRTARRAPATAAPAAAMPANPAAANPAPATAAPAKAN